MTSDSYNVQSCVQTLQTLCVRVPMMLLGGICVTLMMDAALSAILCVMVPVLIVVILCVSRYGIPLYRKVQERLDDVVRVMREDISGIRVVKACLLYTSARSSAVRRWPAQWSRWPAALREWRLRPG